VFITTYTTHNEKCEQEFLFIFSFDRLSVLLFDCSSYWIESQLWYLVRSHWITLKVCLHYQFM